MLNRVRRGLALGAFFVVGGILAGCGGGVPGNSVAVVAGNPITLAAFDHWMYVAAKSQAAQSPGSPVIVPTDPPDFPKCIAQVRAQVATLAKTPTAQIKADCKNLFQSLSSQVMDFLIKAYWYQAEATKDGITVSAAQVQKAFDTAKNQQFPSATQFQSFLTQTGQTLNDILFRFRINKIFTDLIKRHTTTVTAQQIRAYYFQHLSQFGTPQTRNMRIVLAKTQGEANAAKSALRSGQSWKTVAKKYSTDPTSKDNGGLLVGVTQGQEDQALNNAAFAAPVNKLLGPVKGQFGYYVFEVIKITPAKQQPLATATTLIRQTLLGQQQTTAQSAVDAAAKSDWLSQTTCLSAYSMADCNGYTAPKTTSTPTPTAPTPTAPTQSTTPTTATSSTAPSTTTSTPTPTTG